MLLLAYKTNPNKTNRKNATKNMSVLPGLPNTTIEPGGGGGGGGGGGWGTWVNVCWVGAAGLSEPLPHFSLFFGQL